MDQDVEVALRITEAIVAKRNPEVSPATGSLAQSYVALFTEVHGRIKEYLNSLGGS